MKKKLFFPFFAMLFLISCKSNNAFEYSEDFVTSEKKLIPNVGLTENNVAGYIAREHYDSVAIAAKKMEIQIDSLIVSMKAKPAPEAQLGEKFKVDVINYFVFFKSVYTSYINFGKAANADERAQELLKMQQLVSSKDEVINAVQQSQREFAKANGFKLGKK